MGFQRILARLAGKSTKTGGRKDPVAPPRAVPPEGKPAKLPPLFFETLEQRLLLSATPFTFTANPLLAQDLTLSIVNLIGGQTVQLRDTSSGVLLMQKLVADTSTISITMSNQTDELVIASNFGLIGGTVNGLAGTDRIVGGASGSYLITGLDAGQALGLNFTAVEGLRGSSAIGEVFQLSSLGQMSAGIDGAGGADTVQLTGSVSSVNLQVNSASTATLSVTGAFARSTALSNVEVIADQTAPTLGRSAIGSALNEGVTLSQSGTGLVTARFAATMAYTFVQNVGSVTIDEGLGNGNITVTSNLTLPNSALTLRAEAISVGAFTIETAGLTSQGSITLAAAGTAFSVGGTIDGVSATITTGVARVQLNGTTLHSGSISLQASTALSSTVIASQLALAGVNATAQITVKGANLVATTGGVGIFATTTLTTLATATAPAGTTDPGVDAAIAMALARNAAIITLDSSTITGGTSITVRSRNTATMTTTATGSTGAGAVVAASFVEGRTAVDLVGGGSLTSGGIVDVSAQLGSTVTTTATGGAGGATSSKGDSRGEQVLAESNARTEEGAFSVAAAVALADMDRTTEVTLSDKQFFAGKAGNRISSLSSDVLTTKADASASAANVAAAAAINLIKATDQVDVIGIASVQGDLAVQVGELPKAGSRSSVTALSGSSASSALGLAGALALNDADATRMIVVETTADLSVSGNLTMDVTGVSTDIANAQSGALKEAPLGIGASVALNLLNRDTLIAVRANAGLSVDGGVTLQSQTSGSATTLAVAGAAGGTALTPAFAMTQADGDNQIILETGLPLTVLSGLTLTVQRGEAITTEAKGTTQGSSASVGGAVALTLGLQDAAVVLQRDVSAASVAMTAQQRIDSQTKATAAVLGGKTPAQSPMTSDTQAASATDFASSESGETVAAPSAQTPQGGMGIAAALALSIQKGGTQAIIDSGVSVQVVSGAATLTARTDVDASVLADGSVVKATPATAPNVGVGAAVAINLADLATLAEVRGKVVGNLTLQSAVGDPADPTAPGFSALTTRAVAGAGANKVGLAGSFALTSDTMVAVASLASGATAAGGTLTLLAASATTAETTATADARLGAGGSGVGFGIGVAISLLDADATATIAGDAEVGSNSLSLAATTDHTVQTTAGAGAAGGSVAAVPSVALTISRNDATVSLPAGAPVFLTGSASLQSRSSLTAITQAKSSASASAAAVGLSLALTSAEDTALTEVGRSIAADVAIALDAVQVAEISTRAFASAAGNKGTGPIGPQTADDQAGDASNFANSQGATTGGAGSAQSANGKFGLSAALSLGFLAGGAQAHVAADAVLQAGSAASVTAEGDVDAATLADASVVKADGVDVKGVGVGAAVAITMVDRQIAAVVDGMVTSDGSVRVAAGMLPADSDKSLRTTVETTAVAGVGAGDVAVTGAFAMTSGAANALARIGTTGTAIARDKGLILSAETMTEFAATATADATLGGSGGTGVGIGAGVALVLSGSTAQAQVAGAMASTGPLTVHALADSVIRGKGAAGASNGAVTIAPSVFVAVDASAALALIDAGSPALAGDVATVEAINTHTITGDAASAATAATAALGVTVALSVDNAVAQAVVARTLTSKGDLTVTARLNSDVVLRAVASSKGVSQATSGTAGTTADAQIGQQAGFADALGGITGTEPTVQSSGGAFGLAASLALSVIGGGAVARLTATGMLQSDQGTVTVQALGDADSNVLADSSVVKASAATDAKVGVGAAVALNVATRATQAVIAGTVNAATGIVVKAGMAADTDRLTRSVLNARAVAGVGATTAAISGAFAMNANGLSADASPAATARFATLTGPVVIGAENKTAAATTASANAALGQGGSGVGVGVGVALNLMTGQTRADLPGTVQVTGGGLVLGAAAGHVAGGTAAAGATDGTVGVAPSVLLVIDRTVASASLAAGAALTLSGDVSVTALSVNVVAGTARSAGSGSTAGLGVSVALSIVDGSTTAVVDRAITTSGEIKVTASQRNDVALNAVASASGVSTGTSGVGTQQADSQVAKELSFATIAGGPAGVTSPSAESSGGKFGLAAAIGLSIVGGTVAARVDSNASLTSTGGTVTVAALQDVDSSVTADGSTVKGNATTQPNIGVGAAVAINAINRTALAQVDADVSALKGVTITAGMALDPLAVNRSVMSAKAISGVGAKNVGVSGSFALNQINLDATPVVGAGRTITAGGGGTRLQASVNTQATAIASAAANLGVDGGQATGVGVGGAVALNLLDSDSLVAPPASANFLGAGLVLDASGDHIAAGLAQAGAQGGDVTVAPAVYLVAATNTAEARLEGGAGLVLADNVALSASEKTIVSGSANSAATAGTAAIGVALTLAIMENSATARLARDVATTGTLGIGATRLDRVTLTSTASAAGLTSAATGGDTKADQQIGREAGFLNAKAGTSGAMDPVTAPDAQGTAKSVGIAAAVSLSVMTGDVVAELAFGTTVNAGGLVTVQAQSDTDSSATADAKTVNTSVGIGAAVGLNVINQDNSAVVAGDVTSTGLTIRASGLATDLAPLNTVVARAVSGAGASSVGVSGAFAMNVETLTTRALLTGKASQGLTGDTLISATVATDSTATGSGKAINDATGATSASASVGVGLSFGLNLLNDDVTAGLDNGSVLTGGRNVTIAATGSHVSTTRSAAGSGGAVGVSPSLALLVSGNAARAILGDGTALNIQGALSSAARQSHLAVLDSDASAQGDRVAVGAAVALAILPELATASPGRSVTAAGDITLSSDLVTGVKSTTLASTSGVTKSGAGPQAADAQSATMINFANAAGGSSATAPNAAQVGTSGGSQAVGVAAAIALNIVSGNALTVLNSALLLKAGGSVSLLSRMDLDAAAEGDGSSAKGKVGVGVGVGMNVVNGLNQAQVSGTVLAQGNLTVSAIMSGFGDGTDTLLAKANAGVAGSNVGVAGAFAMNISNITTLALVDGTASGGGVVTLEAAGKSSDIAQAVSAVSDRAGGGKGGQVGVGAAVAINILNDDETARVAEAVPLTAGAGLVIRATGDHAATAQATAGAGGDVAVAPAVALNIVTDQTQAVLEAGNAVVATGLVEVSAMHKGLYAATADAEAGGKNVGVGAAVALNVITDFALATIARNVATGGLLTLKAQNQVQVSAMAKGSASGNSSGGSDADAEADQNVNKNDAITSRAGILDVGAAQDGVTEGAAESSSATGGSQPGGVGVGAAVAFNTVVTGSRAVVADGITLASGSDLSVLSSQEVDAAANAQGTAMTVANRTNVGAAVALNVVTAENLALLGVGAKLLADGSVRVQAVDLATDKGGQTNDLTTRAIAGAGADQTAVAASLAVNIAVFNTRAELGDGSVTQARTTALRVQAQSSFTTQNVAGGAAISLGTSVGAAAVVNIFNGGTLAKVDGASIDAAEATVISATTSYVPKAQEFLPGASVNVTSVAGGGAVGTGDASIGGSVVVDVINVTTQAEIADGTLVNQAAIAALPTQSVGLSARTTLTTFSAAGGVGVALGSAGIGAGVTVGVINDTTLALIGTGATVSARGAVSVLGNAAVTRTGAAVSTGLAGTAGIGGSVLVDVYTSRTLALVASETVINAGGLITISATDLDTMTAFSGVVGAGGTTGVGVGLLTVIHTDLVEALLDNNTQVTTHGGLLISAVSGEVLTATAVAGAGGATAGVAASPAVSVLTEATSARIGRSAVVTGVGDTAASPDIVLAAADLTKSTKVAGSVAIGGTAGVGAGLDVATLTKTTEASLGASSSVQTDGSLDIRAGSREDMTSLVMAGAGGGTAAVVGSVGVLTNTITTRAFIEGTNTAVGRTFVDAGNNVIVQASDSSEYDIFVGGLGFSFTASVGASASVPVVNKLTEGFIGRNADVTGRANGAAGSTLDGGFSPNYRALNKGEAEVVVTGVGSGDLPIGQDGQQQAGPLTDTNGAPIDPSYVGNDNAGLVLQLSPSALTMKGVAVVAVNSDDLAQFAMTGTGSGAVAVALSGDVTIFNIRTSARIEDFARINKASGIEGASQDVVVLASSLFSGVTVAGVAAVAGTAAVSPSVAVVVLTEQTEALIGGGADVEAQDSVATRAVAQQDYAAVVAGVSVAGVAAVGGSVGVLQLVSTTRAHIGEVNDQGVDLAAKVFANRDVLVQATDDTDVVTFQGQVTGGGTAAVGASVGVASLVKNTSARIAAGSDVTAMGKSVGGEGLGRFPLDGRFDDAKDVTGLSVLAGASEKITALAFTGAIGPAGAGVAGAVSIAVIDSDVLARIGVGAQINRAALGGLGQVVRVMAENDVDGLGGSGGLGGGTAGIAGAFTIGVVRNAVEADIADGTTILAGGTVKVSARSHQDITSFAASAGVGGGAAALSFAIWVIGGDFSADGGAASESDWAGTYQGQANGSVVSGGYSSVLGASKPFTFGAGATNTTANTIFLLNNGLRTGDAVIYHGNGANIGGLVEGQTYYVIANSLTPNLIKLSTTSAGASAGTAVDLTASLGTGATLSFAATAAADAAILTQRANVQGFGPTINLAASLDDDPASQGTFAHLGALVTINAVDGTRIVADDDLQFVQVAGNIAVGGVAVGASFGTLVHQQPVTAFVGAGSALTLSGFGLDVQALSTEDISQIAVGAAVGSAGDVSGSATINILTEETTAGLGQAVQVQTVRLPGARFRPDVDLVADDATSVSDVAGAASFDATAGVGVGLDVVDLNKVTTATIAEQGLINADGSVILRAHATEDMGSLSVTGAVAGGVAVAGSASVLVLNTTTIAAVQGSDTAATGSVIVADGNVVVEAADDNQIDIFAGAFTVGLAAALGGGAGVPVVNRVARAEIGDNTKVTGHGAQGTDQVRTGTYSDTFTAPGTGDVVSSDIGDGSSGFGEQKSGGQAVDPAQDGRNTSYDDDYQGTAGAGQVHGYAANTTNGKGVMVSATSSDDISSIGVSGGLSGTLAINFSGVVSSVTGQTVARIGDADINLDDGGAAGQDVLVVAGSDFTSLSVAAALSGGSIGGVAPSVAVSFIGLTTHAVIDAGAVVQARDGVQVNACGSEVISFVGAGGGLGGVLGFGATTGVVSLKTATSAVIGAGAVVQTDGSVRVAASDDTRITGIVGAVGAAGIAGAGASAQVIVIEKDTLALIDQNAAVQARGLGTQSAISSALDGVNPDAGGLAGIDIVRGIVVEAKSAEDLSLLSIAAGVGLAFGFGGAVGVAMVDSDTVARIADNATAAAGDATTAADVRVIAGNDFGAFMHTGAGALGIAGLAGALSVGILRNGVLAEIGAGADVSAAGNIAVRGLSSRDIRGFTMAAGAGVGAVAGSVSVWTLGGILTSAYDYDQQAVSGGSPDSQSVSGTTRSEDALASSSWDTDQDRLLQGQHSKTGGGWEDILNSRSLGSGGSSSRADVIIGAGHGTVQADGPDALVSTSLGGADADIEGTTAQVLRAGSLSADGNLDVRAEDVTLFDGVTGGVVLGLGSFGASISLLTNGMGVTAQIIGSAQAGNTLDVIAKSTSNTGNYAITGAGGLIVLGAQVAVTTDTSTRLAEASGGTLTSAGVSNVSAIRNADHQAQAVGVQFSALGGGVSVGMVKLGGSTVARSTSTWSDLADPSGNLVTVSAKTDTSIDVQAWGIGVGLIGAANGAVAWGEDSSIVSATASGVQDMAGGIDVIAAAKSTIDAKGVSGTAAGFGALSAGVAVAKLRPTVSATASLTGTIGAARALASMNADPETGEAIAGLGAHAVSWSLGAALVGIAAAGAISITDVRPVITASNSSTAADRQARAYGGLTANSDARGFAGGLVGFGAGVSFATVAGAITATVSGASSGSVVVDSIGTLNADATTRAVSGGLLSGSANLAYATVSTSLASQLIGTIAATAPGVIDVESHAEGHANAATRGTAIGFIAGTGTAFIGASVAMARYAPTVLAQSTAAISGSTSVTVKATAAGQAIATSGGSGNNSPGSGNVSVGLLATFGGFADATQAAQASASLGNRVISSGIVTVASSATTEAQASTTDLGLGLLTFGASHSFATNTAQSITTIQKAATVTAGQILLSSTGAHYAKAVGNAAGGGLIGGVVAVDVLTAMATGALTTILEGARLTASGQVQAVTRNASEGDGEANAATAGILFSAGGTSGIMNLSTASQTLIGAGAQVTGASVTVQAFGGTQPAATTTNFSYVQNAGNVSGDTISIANHGLVTGQTVQLGTSAVGTWADPDRVYTVLNTGDPNSFRLGAAFDAAQVNAARDQITFADAHGFRTGDRVIYARGGTTSILNGVAPAALFVLVLDDHTIKLLDYDPTTGLRGAEFDGGDVNASTDQIAITGHGFATGQIVTYHLPRAVSFNEGSVDLNATQTAVVTSRNTIAMANHQFQTGDVVTYSIRQNGVAGAGTRLSALITGTQYFVIRVDDNTIRLAATQANAVAGTAIAINQTSNTPTARSTEHILTPAAGAIGGLVDGKSYKVEVVSANAIKLRDTVSNAFVNLTASVTGGSSALVREGVDLVVSTGTQSVFIDMTSAISGSLQGPGGQGLNDTVLSQGDGRSRMLVDGFVVGLGAFTDNHADIDVTSTVRVAVNAGTQDRPTTILATTGNARLQTENRFDAVVDATAGGGGILAVGSAVSHATFHVVTETRIGTLGATGLVNTRVQAAGDVLASAAQITNGGANAFSSGVAGISLADANSFAASTNQTSILVGTGAVLQGRNITMNASTAQVVATTMGVNSDGAGASANAGQNASSGTRILAGSQTLVRVAGGASVLAANALSLTSVINGSRATSNATTHSVALGGDSDATARVTVSEVNTVVLDAGARLQGLGSVTLAARVNDYAVVARSDANMTALGGDTDSTARATATLSNTVVGNLTSLVRTPDLRVDIAVSGGPGLTVTADAPRDGAVGDFGTSSPSAVRNLTNTITFNSNVDLLRRVGSDVALVINAAGVVTTATNASVEGGNGAGFNAGADGQIVVDTIGLDADGHATFNAGTGAVVTGAGGLWTVFKGPANVTITNLSTAKLVLNSINTAFGTLGTGVADVDVDIQVDNAAGLKFDIVTKYDTNANTTTEDQRVTVTSLGTVAVAGFITNPLGQVSITSTGGSIIRGSKSGQIFTKGLVLNAFGDIGQNPAGGVGEGRFSVVFVKAGNRVPTASLIAGGNIFLSGQAVQRDTGAAPTVTITTLSAGGNVDMILTDTEVQTVLPPDHVGGIVVDAKASVINNATPGGGGPISTAQFYREFYYPNSVGGTLSPDLLGVFGVSNGARANATWTVQTETVAGTESIVGSATGATTTVTINLPTHRLAPSATARLAPEPAAQTRFIDIGGPVLTAGALAIRSGLDDDWTTDTVKRGVINWSGAAV